MLCPETINGPALEHSDKEKSTACHDRGEHSEVENPSMYLLEADPEEKKADG
jgi:hypothetical protein